MTETQLKKSVQDWVKSEGGFSIKVCQKYTAGTPDLWICIRGKQLWVELKRPTGKIKIERMQSWTIEQINKAGGNAIVCRSLKEIQNHFGTKSIGKS